MVRQARVVLVVVGVVAAVVAAVASGIISLPGVGSGTRDQASSPARLADQRDAADRQWATATCTNILNWKNEIQRDETSLDPAVSPSARIKNALVSTDRLLDELDELGPPPTARNAQAWIEIEQFRSDLESRLRAVEGTARSAASGNLLAIGTLLSDLGNDRVLGTQMASDLRHVVSVDLGLSLVETRTCRALVGIPF